MQIKKELIKREIAGDVILVPVGKDAIDMNGLIILNDIGAFLWEHIPQAEDENRLVQLLLEEYEVDAETATKDVHEFMDKLTTIGIVEQ